VIWQRLTNNYYKGQLYTLQANIKYRQNKERGIKLPKASKEQIKKDEQKVIHHLTYAANESIDAIAKKCGFSRQKVWRIIKKLEKDHTIWGYTAIVDQDKQGFEHYTALIKRTNMPVDDKLTNKIITQKLDDAIYGMDIEIENSVYTHGIYDWTISFYAKDVKQAKKLCEILKKMYSGYIEDIHLLENLFSIRKNRILNPNSEKLKEFL